MSIIGPARNFALVDVLGSYNDTTTGPISLAAGAGSKIPDAGADGEFNLVWWDRSTFAFPWQDPLAEVIRIVANAGDSLTTITRAQEGTTNFAHPSGSSMMLAYTRSVHEAIDTKLVELDLGELNLAAPPYSMVPDDATKDATNAAAMNAALAYANGLSRPPILRLPAGRFYLTNVTWPTNRVMELRGSAGRASTILSSTANGTPDVATVLVSGTAQEAPVISRIHFEALQGPGLEVDNVKGLTISDCWFSGGKVGHGQLRLKRTFWASLDRLRFSGNGASHAIHMGEPAPASRTTNVWMRNFGSWNLSAGNGYLGPVFNFENVGGVELESMKFDGVESVGAFLKVVNGLQMAFKHIGSEFQANRTIDIHIEDSKLVYLYNVAAGHVTETPTPLNFINSDRIHLLNCFFNGTANGIAADASCDAIHFSRCSMNTSLSSSDPGGAMSYDNCYLHNNSNVLQAGNYTG